MTTMQGGAFRVAMLIPLNSSVQDECQRPIAPILVPLVGLLTARYSFEEPGHHTDFSVDSRVAQPGSWPIGHGRWNRMIRTRRRPCRVFRDTTCKRWHKSRLDFSQSGTHTDQLLPFLFCTSAQPVVQESMLLLDIVRECHSSQTDPGK